MKEQNVNNHLANERTFLAWIRTGIAVMAFGFVVVKFSLFLRQLSMIMNKELIVPQKGYSAVLGISLVAFGVMINLLAYMRYKRVENELNTGSYAHSSALVSALMICILLSGLALVVYLIHSI